MGQPLRIWQNLVKHIHILLHSNPTLGISQSCWASAYFPHLLYKIILENYAATCKFLNRHVNFSITNVKAAKDVKKDI